MSQPYLGEIRMFSGNYAPPGWALCDGQMLHIFEHETLFNLIGTTYGGDGQETFQLPYLSSRIPFGNRDANYIGATMGTETVTLRALEMPAHSHLPQASTQAATSTTPLGNVWATAGNAPYTTGNANVAMDPDAIALAGGSQPHENLPPFTALGFIISLSGEFPSQQATGANTPFMGEIRLFSFGFVPAGWAYCAGALLPINQNQVLFSLLGVDYGGDGRVTFGLPDLRDRAPMHVDTDHPLGQRGGEESHTLTVAELPAHTHAVSAREAASTLNPTGALWAASNQPAYAHSPNVAMASGAISTTGGGQPHENLPPVLSLTFGIALNGIFPAGH